MNIYNDDVVFLSEESAEALVSSLLFDREMLSLRDNFVSDIEQNMSILDNGNSIIVEVPDIELTDCKNYSQVKASVNTKEIKIRRKL